jgi:hypothetical protein
LLAAGKASATVLTYSIKGSSCASITPGVVGKISQWGLNSAQTMSVTCPVILPLTPQYKNVYFTLNGYNRTSTDYISCTLMATNSEGANPITKTLALTLNWSPMQQKSDVLPVWNSAQLYSVSCRIPGGENYLTGIFLGVEY